MGDDARDETNEVHRAVSQQHRQLERLFGEVEASYAQQGGDADAVRDAFAALSEQLDVHFEQEDRLYYAPLGALRPELEPQIRAISAAHRSFRLEIAGIRDQLERGELSPARARSAALADAFQRHEALEEALLRQVEAGIQQER